MIRILNNFSFLCLLLMMLGCAQITEPLKVLWGSSTRALENARVDALHGAYKCSFNDCFDAVLSLQRDQQKDDPLGQDGVVKPVDKEHFDVFLRDRKKRHIIVMGIEGNVDTTEVGIFFSQPNLTTVEIEIASLSSSAKRKVAQIVFDELDARFSKP